MTDSGEVTVSLSSGKHKDKDSTTSSRKRHKKDLDTNDPTRAGFLSYYILWNKSKMHSCR